MLLDQFTEFVCLALSNKRRCNRFAPHNDKPTADSGTGGQRQFFKFTQWVFDGFNPTINLGYQNCPLDFVERKPAVLYGIKQKFRPSAKVNLRSNIVITATLRVIPVRRPSVLSVAKTHAS
jgi:hypothetical protein